MPGIVLIQDHTRQEEDGEQERSLKPTRPAPPSRSLRWSQPTTRDGCSSAFVLQTTLRNAQLQSASNLFNLPMEVARSTRWTRGGKGSGRQRSSSLLVSNVLIAFCSGNTTLGTVGAVAEAVAAPAAEIRSSSTVAPILRSNNLF